MNKRSKPAEIEGFRQWIRVKAPTVPLTRIRPNSGQLETNWMRLEFNSRSDAGGRGRESYDVIVAQATRKDLEFGKPIMSKLINKRKQ